MAYSIEEHEHGVVLRGEIPVGDFAALGKAWKKRRLVEIAPGVASALGATMAVTTKGGTKAWENALSGKARAKAAGDAELEWLLGPDTGTSSLTIFSVLSARHRHRARSRRFFVPSVPLDPDDFGRCHRLLEAIPEWQSRLDRVADRYPEWRPMVREWDGMRALYLEEEPSGTAPKLYAWMHVLRQEGGDLP
jgi:hypothetical protein